MRLTICFPAGVSAAHGSDAWTSKKIAPFRRTARSTSDNGSIAAPQTIEHEGRTGSHSHPWVPQLHCDPYLTSPSSYSRGLCTMSALSGSCFCGEVKFEVTGTPAAMGYCHCESCRHWSAGPVNAFTLWKPESLKVTRGVSSI